MIGRVEQIFEKRAENKTYRNKWSSEDLGMYIYYIMIHSIICIMFLTPSRQNGFPETILLGNQIKSKSKNTACTFSPPPRQKVALPWPGVTFCNVLPRPCGCNGAGWKSMTFGSPRHNSTCPNRNHFWIPSGWSNILPKIFADFGYQVITSDIPSRDLTYPTTGKRNIIFKVAF